MTKIAIRVYTESLNNKSAKERQHNFLNYDRIFVFDTETTTDEYQNLKFGSFVIYKGDIIKKIGLFYNPSFISEKELKMLQIYCSHNHLVKLYSLNQFIEIFYQTVYVEKTLCIGFNLPFDLSRLAFEFGYAQRSMKGGFVLHLSKEKKFPPIRIKHNNSNQSFIRFQSVKYANFEGYFLDLKTLAVTLTDNKHISLETACENFNEKYKKLEVKEHGEITPKYIEYNITDTLSTAELFRKLKEEFDKYEIKIPLNEVYSQASIGKACLEQLGITPFMGINPEFPKELLGKLMTSYYGGRVECKIRKQPTKVTVLDFTSMYPTMFILAGLWNFLIAEKVNWYDDTENVRRFIENITIEDLQKPETWKQLNAIVEIEPSNDILPVRSLYDESTWNVGLNYLQSERKLYYSLADLIVSKLLTGRTLKIIRAYKFVPIGRQKSLKKSKVLGIEINPTNDNLFKVLVEEKERFKQIDASKSKAIKILTNSTSYGIFIEMNREETEKELKVYGLENFKDRKRLEKTGKYFNPLIAIFITSAARLVLGIAESLLLNQGKIHAYCDTDSMFVPSECVDEIQKFFKSLNPYSFDKSLFKVEEEDIWFYGISSKRYVLYRIVNDDFIIDDENYSLHGLGHLLNPFGEKIENWQKQIWLDILKLHHKKITEDDFLRKYQNLFAISQLTITTKEIMTRFNKLNSRKPLAKQIKPFNFFLVGIGNDENVKPIAPFWKNFQEIVHKEFIDYNTGKLLYGLRFWKILNDELLNYIDHRELKFDGNDGILVRKTIKFDEIKYIGKESNDFENVGILGSPNYSEYLNHEEISKKLMKLTMKEARMIGLNYETLRQIKRRMQNKNILIVKKSTVNKILKKQ